MSIIFNSLTVQVDTREHYPLLFPANIRIEDPDTPRKQILIPITTERIKLDAGDYRLKEFPDVCIIERKASLLEINKNLMNPADSVRQCKAFAKLRDSCIYPVLLMEMAPWEIAGHSAKRTVLDPDIVMYRLTKAAAYYNLQLFWAGRTTSTNNRRYLGQVLLYLMYCQGIKAITK